MPPSVRYSVAAAGGTAWYAADGGRRRNARVNYAAALGRLESDPEVTRVARRAFENYSRMLADFLLMGSLHPSEVPGHITVTGREHADKALADGHGAILAMPHMGSWDFAGGLASMLGYRILAVAETFPGSLNDAVVETRSAYGLDIVPTGRSAVRAINRALDRNELVALLCDLPHGPGVTVSFFGRRATVPSGPAAIACRNGVPLLPAYCRRSGPGSYEVHVDPPIHPPAPEDCAGKDGTQELMQMVVQHFERFIRAYPDQWYAFRPILGEPA
ncbi:MAG: lysophospholipid acyltransferase family protein [Candidatus Dormibacteraeota bacterium]|nr:lysophospholipid acyltransferase family protein [Candidatus Dormibacteraeota bacterium]